ncbi:MAG: NUDIX domain-containing protein [Patescibacteria group bacterium]|nr:NUDIX domain-containing protein [Patescibacteria group bacterium]
MKIKNKELHRITSTAIIYKKQKKEIKYLIAQRSLEKKAFPGKWTVPGGGLETDDYINTPKTTKDLWYFAIENSLRREVREEVNLKMGKIKYLLDIVFIIPDGTPSIILSFYAPYKSGQVKLDYENTDFVWATYQEIKKYDLIDGILEEIEMVEKILKGGKNINYKR